MDHFKFYERSDGSGKVTATNMIAPSLTTHNYLHPSFRVYHVDVETNQVVDYDQYRLDLDKWNKTPEGTRAEWDLAYSFLKEYGLSDMSVESFEQVKGLLEKGDKAFLKKYAQNKVSSFKPKEVTQEVIDVDFCDSKGHAKEKYECLKERKQKIPTLLNIGYIIQHFFQFT